MPLPACHKYSTGSSCSYTAFLVTREKTAVILVRFQSGNMIDVGRKLQFMTDRYEYTFARNSVGLNNTNCILVSLLLNRTSHSVTGAICLD